VQSGFFQVRRWGPLSSASITITKGLINDVRWGCFVVRGHIDSRLWASIGVLVDDWGNLFWLLAIVLDPNFACTDLYCHVPRNSGAREEVLWKLNAGSIGARVLKIRVSGIERKVRDPRKLTLLNQVNYLLGKASKCNSPFLPLYS
jgi:hypothetical protein